MPPGLLAPGTGATGSPPLTLVGAVGKGLCDVVVEAVELPLLVVVEFPPADPVGGGCPTVITKPWVTVVATVPGASVVVNVVKDVEIWMDADELD
jgi:hypothetical protein